MIDPFELYQSFQGRVNTYQGGWFRIQTDFINACNVISNELWEKLTRMAEKSQEIRDDLAPFFKSKNYIVNNKSVYGTFIPDKDYGRFSSARIIVSKNKCCPSPDVDQGKCSNGDFKSDIELNEDYYNSIQQHEVELIDDIKWGAVNAHKTKMPTLGKPKMRQINEGFEVAPRLVSVIVLDYYVKPKTATFSYTISPGNVQTGAGDQIIYDKKNSEPLQWPSTMVNQFLDKLEEYYSQFTRDQVLSAITGQNKKTA